MVEHPDLGSTFQLSYQDANAVIADLERHATCVEELQVYMAGLPLGIEYLPPYFRAVFQEALVPDWGDPLSTSVMVAHLTLV